MSVKRANAQQQRFEAILDRYRDKEPRPGAERRHLIRLWQEYLHPMRWRFILAIMLTLFVSVTPFIYAYFLSLLADHALAVGKVIPKAEMAEHYRMLLILFIANSVLHFPEVLCTWKARYDITYIGQRVVFELRRVLHEKLQALPLSFYDRTQTGRLLSVVLDDVATIQMSIGTLGVNIFTYCTTILVGAIIICCLNWKMGLLTFAALPFYVYNYLYYRPKIRDGNIAARRANTALYNRVEERVTAIKTVKVFGRERAEVRSFTESANNLARLTMYILRVTSWQSVLASIISIGITAAILYLGMRALQHGEMTIGQVMWFYQSASNLFNPAIMLSDLVAMEMPRVSVVLRRVFDLLEAEPEPVDRPHAKPLTDAHGAITFSHVTFTYPGDEHATIRDVSFQIAAGKQVAVMGPSGAGKSSLLYLLMRFYDPQHGSIQLDGHDLRDLPLRSTREQITLVMQEPVIFSGTVAENIRYGRLDASDEEVRYAAKSADLHEFIMSLPDGYETLVGEHGMSLSGGQRQRLALAASLLSRPSVLLLDDTTSALDPVTEARVRQTLTRIMHDRTCFVVTHRISTALASDLVMVLEDGGLTQFGTPNELLEEDGLFRRVYTQQTRDAAESAPSPIASIPAADGVVTT